MDIERATGVCTYVNWGNYIFKSVVNGGLGFAVGIVLSEIASSQAGEPQCIHDADRNFWIHSGVYGAIGIAIGLLKAMNENNR